MIEEESQKLTELPANPPTVKPLEYVEPEDGRQIFYCNNHQVGWTAHDIRLLFGELVEITETSVEIEQRVQVTMSWLQAKYLMRTLQERISAYERLNGEIKDVIVP